MIYIDPPYNTGKDSFVYRDKFTMDKGEYNDAIGMYDEDGLKKFQENNTTNPRYHSVWCSMMYPRLKLGKDLLSSNGLIFISVDDNEVHNLRKICDEIFGERNFVAQMIRKCKAGSAHDSSYLAIEYEYCIVYCKDITLLQLNQEVVDTEKNNKYKFEDEFVKRRGKYYLRDLDYKGSYSPSLDYPIETPTGVILWSGNKQGAPNVWRWSKEKVEWGKKNGFIVFKDNKVYIKQYQFVDNNDDLRVRTLPYRAYIEFLNGEATQEVKALVGDVFSYPKPVSLVKYMLKIASNNEDIILDFFSGSATTAHAVVQLNAEDCGKRKFIMVQFPEICDKNSEATKKGYKTICDIGKERIRRAGEKIKSEYGLTAQNLDVGFRVLKLDEPNETEVKHPVGGYTQDMIAMMENNIKSDRNDLDLLYGCLLEWGLELSKSYTVEEIDGFKVHTYNGDLIACFDEHISEKVVREIAGRNPLYAVFRDRCFTSSSEKINVFEIFKQLAPNMSEEPEKNVKVI